MCTVFGSLMCNGNVFLEQQRQQKYKGKLNKMKQLRATDCKTSLGRRELEETTEGGETMEKDVVVMEKE